MSARENLGESYHLCCVDDNQFIFIGYEYRTLSNKSILCTNDIPYFSTILLGFLPQGYATS